MTDVVMIFGEQLIEILTMLDWSPAYFAKLMKVQAIFVRSAIIAGGPARFTDREEARMREILRDRGVMLLDPKGQDSGVRFADATMYPSNESEKRSSKKLQPPRLHRSKLLF